MNLYTQFTLIVLFFTPLLIVAEPCQNCHESHLNSCNLKCEDCHQSAKADYVVQAHPAIIRNPSDERWWPVKCAQCHETIIQNFKQSGHYNNTNMIEQTRFLWGKVDTINSGQSGVIWKNLSHSPVPDHPQPEDLVDNLLAKKCMRCHFNSNGKDNSAGQKHSSGCAVCHLPLDQNNGQPLFNHKMQKRVNDRTCLTCHSANRVGGDYYGYFEHDYHQEYATPYESKPVFGAYQHRLQRDIHQRAGLQCTDCHLFKDNSDEEQNSHRIKTLQCENCHGGFTSKANAKHLQSTPFNPKTISHRSFHSKLECSSCHAQWSYQDYGLHLFLDESRNYPMWRSYKWQSDPQVLSVLNHNDTTRWPYTKSYISADSSLGIWYKGWTFRRWDDPPLGWNKSGKISIIRPLYQYYISYVDSSENIWLDSAVPTGADGQKGWNWDAYTPHSSGKTGRSCESCHGNIKAAGLGLRQNLKDMVSNNIALAGRMIEKNARPLNAEEQKRLLVKSKQYKMWRSRAFKSDGIDSLFQKK